MMWKDNVILVLKTEKRDEKNKEQKQNLPVFLNNEIESNWERIFIISDKMQGSLRYTLNKDG